MDMTIDRKYLPILAVVSAAVIPLSIYNLIKKFPDIISSLGNFYDVFNKISELPFLKALEFAFYIIMIFIGICLTIMFISLYYKTPVDCWKYKEKMQVSIFW